MSQSLGRSYPNVRYKSKSNAIVSAGGGTSNPFSRVAGSFMNNSYGSKDFIISKVSGSNDLEHYSPKELISTMDIAHYFFPLLYAGEKGALGIWDKSVGQGHIKRRVEEQAIKKFHVLELINGQTNTGTFISVPSKDWKALHLNLPHLVIVMKNFKRNFSFEVLCLDNRGVRRRLSFATWYIPGNLKRYSFLCHIPLRLDSGWNEIHLDLRELIHSIYKTRFVETLRVQIHANCRLRQVFFCGDEVINQQEMVPSMKVFNNIELLNPEFGPVSHPNFYEPGPERQLHVLHNSYGHGRSFVERSFGGIARMGLSQSHDPLGHFPLGPTRLEKDLKMIHNSRYEHLANRRHNVNSYQAPGTAPTSKLPRNTSSETVSSTGSKQESSAGSADSKGGTKSFNEAGTTTADGSSNTNNNNNADREKLEEKTRRLKSETIRALSIPSEMHKSMTLVEIMQRNERLRRREELLEAIALHQAQQAELRQNQKRKEKAQGRSEATSSSPPIRYKPPSIPTPPSDDSRPSFYFEPKNTPF